MTIAGRAEAKVSQWMKCSFSMVHCMVCGVSNMANPSPVYGRGNGHAPVANVALGFPYETPPLNNNTILSSAVPSVVASSPADGELLVLCNRKPDIYLPTQSKLC